VKVILRNFAALALGVLVGGATNMGLILLGAAVIPAPAGVDVSNTESIAAGMHLFELKHFVFPFLAHAVGTLIGSLCAFLVAATHRRTICYSVGVTFLAGGIAAAFMIPAPVWFLAIDIVAAYIPMAWIATLIANRVAKGAAIAHA